MFFSDYYLHCFEGAVMVDVTADNFEQLWPSIKKNIDESVLIGIDSEFSGIVSSTKLKNRYVTDHSCT